MKAWEPRFWAKVDKSGECWLWTAAKRNSYGVFSIDGRLYSAHRVSLLIAGVDIPDGLDVDHICRDRSCVNPKHLRTATRKQNKENAGGAHRDSASGVLGVYWSKQHKKWRATVTHNGRNYHCGLFDSLRDAEAAVVSKRNELFTHNERDRRAA